MCYCFGVYSCVDPNCFIAPSVEIAVNRKESINWTTASTSIFSIRTNVTSIESQVKFANFFLNLVNIYIRNRSNRIKSQAGTLRKLDFKEDIGLDTN